MYVHYKVILIKPVFKTPDNLFFHAYSGSNYFTPATYDLNIPFQGAATDARNTFGADWVLTDRTITFPRFAKNQNFLVIYSQTCCSIAGDPLASTIWSNNTTAAASKIKSSSIGLVGEKGFGTFLLGSTVPIYYCSQPRCGNSSDSSGSDVATGANLVEFITVTEDNARLDIQANSTQTNVGTFDFLWDLYIIQIPNGTVTSMLGEPKIDNKLLNLEREFKQLKEMMLKNMIISEPVTDDEKDEPLTRSTVNLLKTVAESLKGKGNER